MPALSYSAMYDAPPSFLPQPPPSSNKMQYAVSHSALPPHPPSSHTPPPGSVTSSPFHHSVRRVAHSPSTQQQQQQQQQESIVYAHSSPLPHAQMQPHAHLSGGGSGGSSSGGQSVYVVHPSHSYSPPGSFQRGLPAPVSTVAQPYHIAVQQQQHQQPHSPTHAGAFRPFKSAPISPPSAIRPGVVYPFPPSSVVSSGSPSSPVPVAASSSQSQPTILIHSSSYSPSAPYPRLLSSPVPHSPGDAVLRPLAVRRTGSPPLPSPSMLSVPLTSQSSCPTCSQHSHPPQHHHAQHTRTLSNGFIVASGPQYHTVQSHPQHPQPHPHSQPPPPHHPHHPPLHSSHRLSPACLAAGCAYPVSPRSEHRMVTSDDDDAYSHQSHHSHHSHLSLPSSSSSSSPSLGQPRYTSGGSSYFISSSASASSSAPPMQHHQQQQQQQHPQPHYVVAAAGSYDYSPPVAHSHLQVLPSHQPGRVGLPSHVQYGAPPPGTAYTVQSIPIATLSPSSASPSSASSTSSAVSASGPFPSAASSTSVGSSSSLSAPSSPRAAKSKRSAAHMREFVRNYFLRHSASLVNKDLTSISAELQAAYEKETSNGESVAADSAAGDRKPVFCRTFIQKVARSLGFILTLHFGLVDKRMKHLMKIRKRGKKNSKKHSHSAPSSSHGVDAAGTVKPESAEADGEAHSSVKHEKQHQSSRGRAADRSAGVEEEDEVAAAAHHMEEMAAALEARGVERAVGGSAAAAAARVLVKEEDDQQHDQPADRSGELDEDVDEDDDEGDDGEENEAEDDQPEHDNVSTPRRTAAADDSAADRGSDTAGGETAANQKVEEAAAAATKMDL